MSQPWLHPAISKDEAEEKLKGLGLVDGNFLVRKHKTAGKYVLSIVFKGKPTHHLCSKNDDGVYGVNNKTYGASSTTITKLISHLKTKPQGWPVHFKDFVPREGSGGGGVNVEKSSGGSAGKKGPWLHGPITKEAADEFLGKEPNPNRSGRFLVRKRKTKGQYVLSIGFKGKGTHHSVVKNEDGIFAINGKVYSKDASTLTKLLDALAAKPVGWPVALVEYVSSDGSINAFKGLPDTISAPTKSAQPKATPTKTKGGGGGKGKLLHGAIPKTKAEELLYAANGGDKKDGTFLFRSKPNSDKKAYVLSVIFKGRATHHLVTRESVGGDFTVNKTLCEGVNKVKALATHLKTKKPWWPAPLLYPVMAEGTASAASTLKKKKKDPVTPVATDKISEDDDKQDTNSKVKDKDDKKEVEADKKEDKSSSDEGKENNETNNIPVITEAPPPVDINKPVREFVGGSIVEVSLVRKSTSDPWGFGIASEWLGVNHGHANVVSSIAINSPADGAVKIHDIFIQIDGHLVESSSLNEVVESMVDTDTVVKFMLYRRATPPKAPAAPDLAPVFPEKKPAGETLKNWWQTNVVRKFSKDKIKPVQKKDPFEVKPKRRDLAHSSIWDSQYQQEEERAITKVMKRQSKPATGKASSKVTVNMAMSPQPEGTIV